MRTRPIFRSVCEWFLILTLCGRWVLNPLDAIADAPLQPSVLDVSKARLPKINLPSYAEWDEFMNSPTGALALVFHVAHTNALNVEIERLSSEVRSLEAQRDKLLRIVEADRRMAFDVMEIANDYHAALRKQDKREAFLFGILASLVAALLVKFIGRLLRR